MNDIDILKQSLSGDALSSAIEQYENGIPAAYILGEWEFCGDRYKIDESCLIPRCDTERTVEKLTELLPENGVFADLCTGSGCIAISTLKRRNDAKAKAADISIGAIKLAKENAVINSVENRIEFICADIKNDIFAEEEKFDIIVSNPPYIPTGDLQKLDEYVKKEPVKALDGGEDGMDFYRTLTSVYKKHLKSDGVMIFEIGYDQEEQIKLLAQQNKMNCTVTKDYSGNPRVAVLKPTTEENL